jgi:RNA polymerase sigma-70 factor (ECF subfamily)
VSIERGPAKGAMRGTPAQRLDAETSAKDRQMQAWQQLYQEHLEPIYRYIYSKVGNREEAEDLTEQTFIKAVRTIDYARSPLSIQKWLFQIARTTIADYWRAYYRLSTDSLETLLAGGWEGPIASLSSVRESLHPTERVRQILVALPKHYREVLNCRFLLSLSIKETAASLGLTEANVKVLQFRALNYAALLEKKAMGSNDQQRGE